MLEGANYVPSLREYTARWGVTTDRLRPGQKVMHPGPMNRGVEIDDEVADMADALIERQVRSGLVVRMAVLYDLLTHGPGRGQGRRDRGGGLMLAGQSGRRQRRHSGRQSRSIPREGVDALLDIRIDAGVISRIEPAGSRLDLNEHRVVEGEGLVLAPAFVDPHVHLRTPGREDEEDISSGTRAAAAGGLLRHPRDAEHRSGRRLGVRPRRPGRAGPIPRRRSRSGSSRRSRRVRQARS